MSNPVVAILMGSKSDFEKIESAVTILTEFGIPFTARIMSAHRTPHIVSEFSKNAANAGYKIIIAAAGMAAHLAGVVAAHTQLPVIGIPVQGGAFHGMDALLSTVQMPGGIPVASVAVGSAGGKNAALFAIRILALTDPVLASKLDKFRDDLRLAVIEADNDLQKNLST